MTRESSVESRLYVAECTRHKGKWPDFGDRPAQCQDKQVSGAILAFWTRFPRESGAGAARDCVVPEFPGAWRFAMSDSAIQTPAPASGAPSGKQKSKRQRERERVRSYVPTLSSYFEAPEVTLGHGYTQRTFELGLAPGALSVFQIDVMLPVLARKRQDLVKEFRAQLSQAIADMRAKLDEQIALYERLLNDQGMDTTLRYHSPKTYAPQLFTPSAVDLLDLLKKMDKVVGYADKLWWNRVIDSDAHQVVGVTWQRELMAFFRRLHEIHVRGRRSIDQLKSEAQRRSQPREKDAAAAADAPHTTVEAAVDTPLAQASASAAEVVAEIERAEEQLVESAAAAPEAAAQLAATSAAIVAKATRRRGGSASSNEAALPAASAA